MKTIISIITVVALSSLSACSQIKSYFPDKEREYQYTAELPQLIYPADLKVKVLPVLPAAMTKAEPVNTPPVLPTKVATTPTAAKATPVLDKAYSDEEELSAQLITVERINADKGENRLRLNVPYIRAWRILGKSLSRKALEVTLRDQDAGLFTVKYDPDEQDVKDLSYIDSLKALIGDLRSNEKTYNIKLEKDQPNTEVTVLDKDQKPTTDADSVKLLMLLQEAIKADLATNK
jgi:outer membrane protein assembly factor BamC